MSRGTGLYLEQVLRLAPQWPVNRVIELAPKYWAATFGKLDARQREIIEPPWLGTHPIVSPQTQSNLRNTG